MKQIISLEEFKIYNNYYEEDTDIMCQSFIDAASNIVADYIGFDPNRTEYNEFVEGIGSNKLFTKVIPIVDFAYVLRVDTGEALEGVGWNENYIYSLEGDSIFEDKATYKIHYEGGYRNVPDEIKLAVIRIASLMLAESNGNIGITGKSNADQSRTFISYNSYDKYLKPLISYRCKSIV